ncbi:hypothetical protein Cylst_0630 [Cylindrospermum stagnale PCC 7417]|uniref:Uncharacterized protein n=1 Tax=Cylindrospermum stagnale PCC 7417 TaxID=56107 RepID=K9WTT9_9NOST|nr:hypothetical protein Cylst_0630 [Cylindrospermum stagnale PCC 7417]
MMYDVIIPNSTTYLLVKIFVLILALLLWFTITAAPVI